MSDEKLETVMDVERAIEEVDRQRLRLKRFEARENLVQKIVAIWFSHSSFSQVAKDLSDAFRALRDFSLDDGQTLGDIIEEERKRLSDHWKDCT